MRFATWFYIVTVFLFTLNSIYQVTRQPDMSKAALACIVLYPSGLILFLFSVLRYLP